MLNIALFGPPCAGKGTQAQFLVSKYNLTYLSTGDILRKNIADNTKLGQEARAIMEKGQLVSDEIVAKLIEDAIEKLSNKNGVLFDGFPRTSNQAVMLDELLKKFNSSLTGMLSLEVPKNVLIERMLERSVKESRADDTIEVIEDRLVEYNEKTLPVSDHYKKQGKFYPVDGLGSIEDVHKRLVQTIDSKISN